MPDPQNDRDRPAGAPLSATEADRLSERFTASWDDPELPSAAPPQAAPVAALTKTAPLKVPAGLQTPPAAAQFAAKPKQTLLGIAPIVVGPSQPPPVAPAVVAPAPAPVVSAPPPSSPSSPDASSVARGLTTPSKPYIPKDDPSTPAVVISEAALVEKPRHNPDRARIAQTIPAQMRSVPFTVPPVAPAAPKPVVATVPEEPLARSRSKALPIAIGAVALLAIVGVAIVKLGSDKPDTEATSPTASAAALAVATPTTTAAPVATVEAAATERVAAAAPVEPAATAAADEPAPAPTPSPKRAGAAKPAAAPRKSTPPAPRKAATAPKAVSAPAAEPTPTKPKGVIVRETPF